MKMLQSASRCRRPFLCLTFSLFFFIFLVTSQFCFANQEKSRSSTRWYASKIIRPTKRKPAKTCILIIAPPSYGDSFSERRWALGKRVWERYMNTHPDIDCYFVACANLREDISEQVWGENNMIYVGDELFKETKILPKTGKAVDRILHKTIKAMEYLDNQYTHFIRTNINTFFDLNAVANFSETHHQSFFSTPLWEKEWYTIGYAIVYTADVAEHMIHEYNRLDAMCEELVTYDHSDDAIITALATGVWPLGPYNPFRCCSSLKPGLRQLLCRWSLTTNRFSRYGLLLTSVDSLQEAIDAFSLSGSETMLVRTRDGLDLDELAKLYQYMLSKTYPELGNIILTDY